MWKGKVSVGLLRAMILPFYTVRLLKLSMNSLAETFLSESMQLNCFLPNKDDMALLTEGGCCGS